MDQRTASLGARLHTAHRRAPSATAPGRNNPTSYKPPHHRARPHKRRLLRCAGPSLLHRSEGEVPMMADRRSCTIERNEADSGRFRVATKERNQQARGPRPARPGGRPEAWRSTLWSSVSPARTTLMGGRFRTGPQQLPAKRPIKTFDVRFTLTITHITAVTAPAIAARSQSTRHLSL